MLPGSKLRILQWIALATLTKESFTQPNRVSISDQALENAFLSFKNVVAERVRLETQLVQEGKIVNPNIKQADVSILRRRRTDPFVHLFEANQLIFQAVTKDIIERLNLNDQQISQVLPILDFNGQYCSQVREDCLQALPNPQCDGTSRYRTADGTCNNLRNPTWGSAFTCFRRLLPAEYTGASGFRQSVRGGPLPEPRDLSVRVHSRLDRQTNYVTHLYMFFGQLLDHDITQASISTTVDNQAIECCPGTGQTHPQCAPINIRSDDYFYSQFGIRCLNFVRSAICPTCTLGYRDQINQITAFIDGSFIYGNSLNETLNLRTNDGTGRLRVERSAVGDLLPPSPDPQNDLCSFPDRNEICFQSGDARINQHTTLASLHTIFVREHNRIADFLRRINPQWNGERLFQEARRIIGAEMQVITYKEFLPITLGPERMSFFRLPLSNGFTDYDANVDPSLYNSFSGAAFRFGHSLINSLVALYPRTNGNQGRMLRDEFFQPFELRDGLIDPLMRGVSNSPAQWFDRHVTPDVTNFLYRVRGNSTGLDLASFNIQRGRDHGLFTYTRAVQFCSANFIIRRFSDLVRYGIMSRANAQLLEQNYRDVNDIDLWTGILSEYPNENAVVGPTATCIIGLQFKHLKYGDRFYFEHRNQVGSFTFDQIQELKKASLSKIICDNTEVNQIALNAMLFGSRNNPVRNCRNIEGIDLNVWRV